MEVGGYNDVPDWPKMGPSLLIATALIVAIRTAKWSATIDARNSNCELDKEIDFAAGWPILAGVARVGFEDVWNAVFWILPL